MAHQGVTRAWACLGGRAGGDDAGAAQSPGHCGVLLGYRADGIQAVAATRSYSSGGR
jgi:hypothetical protein